MLVFLGVCTDCSLETHWDVTPDSLWVQLLKFVAEELLAPVMKATGEPVGGSGGHQ